MPKGGAGSGVKETLARRRPQPSKVMETLSRLFALKGKNRWQQTTWGRLLIGLILAQGLYIALSQMAWALMMLFGDRAAVTAWRESLGGLLLKQFFQGISVVAGGIVAGAGMRRAVRNGTIVGLYNGFLFLVYDAFLSKQPNLMGLIGQPLLQIAFGTLGGYLGRVIWAPAQPIVSLRSSRPVSLEGEREVGTATLDTAGLAPIPLPEPRKKPNPFTGQIYWVRVAIGVCIVVAGSVSAEMLLNRYILDPNRPGLDLRLETKEQSQFITWEISVLAMIFGGAFAGANTYNGPLQGIIVGMIATTVLIANIFQTGMGGNADAAHTLGLSFLGIKLNSIFLQIVGTILSVMPLSIVGGWFGGQLLPPVLAARKISKTYTAPV